VEARVRAARLRAQRHRDEDHLRGDDP
jgi:hypothetical protein